MFLTSLFVSLWHPALTPLLSEPNLLLNRSFPSSHRRSCVWSVFPCCISFSCHLLHRLSKRNIEWTLFDMVPMTLKREAKQNKTPKNKMKWAAPGDRGVHTQPFLFLTSLNGNLKLLFWVNICALCSRLNLAYLVSLDTSYFVTSLCLLSPSLPKHEKWMTSTTMGCSSWIQSRFTWLQGSNCTSLVRGQLPPGNLSLCFD